MVITKYESYYNKIVEKLEVIKTEQSYANLSLAFAHWFLENQYEMSEQEVAESIIDGDGDNGIDATILTNMQLLLKDRKEGYTHRT
ncbi:MAG: hypothetical protein KH747_00880 [Streptococcus salivarius]|nr:hypothetical protein [Streptococcus salivarius]